MKRLRKLIAAILVVVMVCSSVPVQAFDDGKTSSMSEATTAADDSGQKEEKSEEINGTKKEEDSSESQSSKDSDHSKEAENKKEVAVEEDHTQDEIKNDGGKVTISKEEDQQLDSNPEGNDENGEGQEDLKDKEEIPTIDPDQPIQKFVIKGSVQYADEGWKDLIRPQKFEDSIMIKAQLIDAEGNHESREYRAQDDDNSKDFYLMFVDNGQGGGDFTLKSVPKQVEIEGKRYAVQSYSLSVKENTPYYESNEQKITSDKFDDVSQAYATLTETMVTKNVKFTKKVVPEGEYEKSFPMELTFDIGKKDENGNLITYKKKISIPVENSDQGSYELEVPISAHFQAKESQVEGYRIVSYETKTDPQNSSKESKVTLTKDNQTQTIEGKVEEDYELELLATNSFMDYACQVNVKWADNGDKDRKSIYPNTVMPENLTLKYRLEGSSEYRELTQSDLDILGMDAIPTCQLDREKGGHNYLFEHLPTVDIQGNRVEYTVEETTIGGYKTEYKKEEGKQSLALTITNTKLDDFTAYIGWYDDYEEIRPDQSTMKDILNVYCLCDGKYKEVELSKDDIVIEEVHSSIPTDCRKLWKVTVNNLPMFTEENVLNEYCLVQGTILEDGSVSPAEVPLNKEEGIDATYRSDYENGTAEHGNDNKKCFDKGSILNTLTGSLHFTAKKVWKDEESCHRPKTTVTLWRYAIKPGRRDDNIDDHLDTAARVIYRLGQKDYLLSYDLETGGGRASLKDNEETIDFAKLLPEGSELNLPLYDERGYRYCYFVRETVENSEDTDDYVTTYTAITKDGEKSFNSGTLNGGTITNLRKEKVEIVIGKAWKAPATLNDIENISIEYSIQVPTDNGIIELTPISENAGDFTPITGQEQTNTMTCGGFSKDLDRKNIRFYVNGRDEKGKPYNFQRAIINEKKVFYVKADGEIETLEITDGRVITLPNGHTYEGRCSAPNIKESNFYSNMTSYDYLMTNVISGLKPYDIVKQWSGFEPEQYNITAVYADLVGYSEDPDTTKKPYTTIQGIRVTQNETGEWIYHTDGVMEIDQRKTELQKYDENGYLINYKAKETKIETSVPVKSWGDDYEVVEIDGQNRYLYTRQNVSNISTRYQYTDKSTTIINEQNGGPTLHIEVEKHWIDDGDDSARMPVEVHIFDAITKEDYSDLDKSDPKYLAPILLYKGNLWYQDQYYSLESFPEGTTSANFVAKEVMLRNDSSSFHVTYHSSNEDFDKGSFQGKVSTHKRNYRVINTRTINGQYSLKVDCKNIRLGYTDLYIKKNWVDGNNYSNTRPESIRIQIRKDGNPWRPTQEELEDVPEECKADLDENGILTIRGTGENNIGSKEKLTVIGIDAEDNQMTGSQWIYYFGSLPKYDEKGKEHFYDYEEIPMDASSYLQTSNDFSTVNLESLVESDEIKSQLIDHNYLLKTFTNTLYASREFTVYKKWKDAYTRGKDRPDLYLHFYRHRLTEEEHNTEGWAPSQEDEELTAAGQTWTPGRGESYDWKINIKDLSAYDEQGYPYYYYVVEEMNNDGRIPCGKYEKSYGSFDTDGKFLENDENKSFATNGQYIINTLTDHMTVSGYKRWNIDGEEIPSEELPIPEMWLYRYVDSNFEEALSPALIEEKIAAGDENFEKVDQVLMEDDRTSYSFPSQKYLEDHNNETFDKYNENGDKYSYYVYEKKIYTNLEEKKDISNLYDVDRPSIASNMISNVFPADKNTRVIRVHKNWNRQDGIPDIYPNVTYKLYRYLKPENGKVLSPEEKTIEDNFYDTKTITAQQFMNAEDKDSLYVEFDHLPIFSPNGTQYYYFIQELPIKGYSVNYTDEDGNYPGTVNEEGIEISKAEIGGKGIDIQDLTESVNMSNDVGSTNIYDQSGLITLSGEKLWKDYKNKVFYLNESDYDPRPETIELVLKRYTNETGENDGNGTDQKEILLSDEKVDGPWIEWNKNEDPYKWTYQIHNLPKYAPNGNTYIYVLSEKPVEGYQLKEEVSVNASGESQGVLKPSKAMTNVFGKNYTVQKNWFDGGNRYGLRPKSLTFYLEYSIDDGEHYQKMEWNDTMKAVDLPSVDSKYVSVCLTEANEIKNTNSWRYTFNYLPKYARMSDGSLKEVFYRCVETKIGDIPVEKAEDGTESAGAYTVEYSKQDKDSTIVGNQLETTELHVKKEWHDKDDFYQGRPESLTFLLQCAELPSDRTTPTEADWKNLEKPYTFTISAGEGWETNLMNLPVSKTVVEKDGTTTTVYRLYYRAVEVYEGNGQDLNYYKEDLTADQRVPLGAGNYQDITDYSKDWKYDSVNFRNEITITNQIVVGQPKSIKAKKVWKRRDQDADLKPQADIVFELQYKVANNTENNTENNMDDETEESEFISYEPKLQQTLSKNTGADKYYVEWTDLPAYNLAGKELQYRIIENAVDGYYTKITEPEEEKAEEAVWEFANVESRGIVTFTKTDEEENAIHLDDLKAGESKVYFGLYTDSNCTNQIGGMEATGQDPSKMELVNKDKDGNPINAKLSNGLDYLSQSSRKWTLVSGTYYIKELRAPSGYQISSMVYKASIPKIGSATTSYLANVGTVANIEGSQITNITNQPNHLSLYKMDQYGQNVSLGDDNYLILSSYKDGALQDSIRLYQNSASPVKKADGSGFTQAPAIAYADADNHWTFEAFFDEGLTYIIKEESNHTPEKYLTAKSFTFTVKDGIILPANGSGSASANPLTVSGTVKDNTYKADATNNMIVLRDNLRLYKLSFQKEDSDKQPISNISFGLYKYTDGQADLGDNSEDQSVLADGIFLTTDAEGTIDIGTLSDGIINQISDKPLKDGLDLGKYYLIEQEAGASDIYQLKDPIYFEIVADNEAENGANISWGDGWSEDGTIVNEEAKGLQLDLIKKASKDNKLLAGAEFTLTYESINHGQAGAHDQTSAENTILCVTNDQGQLVGKDDSKKVDISRKGHYSLVETKSSTGYLTIRNNNGQPAELLAFDVNDQMEMTNVSIKDSHVSLGQRENSFVVKNDMAKLYIDKTMFSKTGNKLSDATLAIYKEKVFDEDGNVIEANRVERWTTDGSTKTFDYDLFEKDQVYILHEEYTPDQYGLAADIRFKVDGTIVKSISGKTMEVANVLDIDRKVILNDYVITMVDTTFATNVTLHKYDEASKANVKGAVFTLYEGNQVIASKKMGEYSTDESGNLNIAIATKGTYTLVETKAAEDYYLPESKDCFHKTFTITDKDFGQIVDISPEASSLGDPKGVPNKHYGQVTFTKVDLDSKEELDGVKFQLSRKEKNGSFLANLWEFITGKQYKVIEGATYTAEEDMQIEAGKGTLIIGQLIWGDYKLKEIEEKDGYILSEKEYPFTIDVNHVSRNIGEIANEKNGLTIKKTDGYGDILSGAQFQILNATTKQPVSFFIKKEESNPDKKVNTVTVGEKGTVSIYGLKKGSYELHEVKAPEGYVLLTENVSFTVKADGSIEGKNATHGTISGNTITVDNVKIDKSLWKVDSTDLDEIPIKDSGAVFQIEGRFANAKDKSILEGITPENFQERTSGLFVAKEFYDIKEVTPAFGYVKQNSPATFTVNEDGTLVVTKGKEFLHLSQDKKTLIFLNDPAPHGQLKVEKIWKNDSDWKNTLGKTTVDLQLYVKAEGESRSEIYGNPKTLGDPDAKTAADVDSLFWKGTWEDLPLYRNDLSEDGTYYTTKKLVYEVKELDVPEGYEFSVSYGEKNPYDAKVTNTVLGGEHKGWLKIQKNLGGGSNEQIFKMSVDLSRTVEDEFGQEQKLTFGKYRDSYDVYDVKTNQKINTVEAKDGVIQLKGGQYALLPLPAGMHYKVTEDLDFDSDLFYLQEYTNEEGVIAEDTTSEATILNIVQKHLDLTKIALETDADGNHKALDGVEFRIDYISLDGKTKESMETRTDSKGMLYLVKDGELTNQQPDLTRQGSYAITETKTKNTYVLPTDENRQTYAMITIYVGEDHHITMEKAEAAKDLVSYEISPEHDTAYIKISNRLNSVKVRKVDKETKQILPGAAFLIMKDEEVIREWVSTKDPMEIKGLEAGVTYTLVETCAPYGYELTDPIFFQVDEDGRVDTSYVTVTDEETLLVEDVKLKTSGLGRIKVEKKVAAFSSGGEDPVTLYANEEKTFRIGLFIDKSGTTLYDGPQPAVQEVKVYKDIVSTPAIWTGLQDGTYYIYEVDENNKKIDIGGEFDQEKEGVLFYCDLEDHLTSNQIVIDKEHSSVEGLVGLKNVFEFIPEGYRQVSYITVNKAVLRNGRIDDSDKHKFYAGVFESPDAEEPIQKVSQLNNNGSIRIPVPANVDGSEITYYVYETDQGGHKVGSDFAYNVTVSNDGMVTTSSERTEEEITITNHMLSVDFQKVDADDHEKILKGATFQITNENGKEVDRFTFDGKAHTVDGLKPGEVYTITEITAPDHYKSMQPVTFTVDENGKLPAGILPEAGQLSDNGNHCYLLENKKIPEKDKPKKKDSKKTKKKSDGSRTYDDWNLYPYLLMMLGAVMGIVTMIRRRIKR